MLLQFCLNVATYVQEYCIKACPPFIHCRGTLFSHRRRPAGIGGSKRNNRRESADPGDDSHGNGGICLIDLHVHSQHSDGTFTPPELIDLASQSGLSWLSITDHDTVSGLRSAVQAAAHSNVRLITGLEISVDQPRAHILGYGIDYHDDQLRGSLERVAESRRRRNPRIVQRLQQLGYEVTEDDVEAQSDGDIIGRVHIAKALVETGYFANTGAVFDNLIGWGRPPMWTGAAHCQGEFSSRMQELRTAHPGRSRKIARSPTVSSDGAAFRASAVHGALKELAQFSEHLQEPCLDGWHGFPRFEQARHPARNSEATGDP